MARKFFTYNCHCSVDTELIDRKDNAKNCINCVFICSEVYRQLSTRPFLLKIPLDNGVVARKVGCPLSASSNSISSAILSQAPCGLFSAEYHFFSEPGPINDHCQIPNFFASTLGDSGICQTFFFIVFSVTRCH